MVIAIKDAEFVSETVIINRLYHRELIARMSKIDELEKKWNCKIDFPSTEMASDVVTISGPEWQVPQALDDFLVSPISCPFVSRKAKQVLGYGPGKPRDCSPRTTTATRILQD